MVQFTINGKAASFDDDPSTPLLSMEKRQALMMILQHRCFGFFGIRSG
jgi:hypothetical protein